MWLIGLTRDLTREHRWKSLLEHVFKDTKYGISEAGDFFVETFEEDSITWTIGEGSVKLTIETCKYAPKPGNYVVTCTTSGVLHDYGHYLFLRALWRMNNQMYLGPCYATNEMEQHDVKRSFMNICQSDGYFVWGSFPVSW